MIVMNFLLYIREQPSLIHGKKKMACHLHCIIWFSVHGGRLNKKR